MAIGQHIKKYQEQRAAAEAADAAPEVDATVDDTEPAIVIATEADYAREIAELRALKAELQSEREQFRAGAPQPQAGISGEQLERILANNTKATQKALKPENVEGSFPPVSAFNPTGDLNKVKLRRKTVYVGAEMRNDFLTPTEIELFNQFTVNKEARLGRWTAKIIRNGTTEELHVGVPHKDVSDRMDLPSGLTLILRELLDGPEAASVDFMAERLAAAEKQIAALTGAAH